MFVYNLMMVVRVTVFGSDDCIVSFAMLDGIVGKVSFSYAVYWQEPYTCVSGDAAACTNAKMQDVVCKRVPLTTSNASLNVVQRHVYSE